MYPYNFKQENYSKLGYIYEGITTYMGDLFLFKSGVFDFKAYALEFNNQLQKHFDNTGRFNYSVAQSSFDTWLDGYVPGAPGRKVSIYTEGCLLAFVIDVLLLKHSNNKMSLDFIMKNLYFNYALAQKGVSEQDFKEELLKIIPSDIIDNLFSAYIHGVSPFESIIAESLEYLGLDLGHKPSNTYSAGRLGMKCIPQGSNFIVKSMFPGGPAELGGLQLEDELIAINDYLFNNELDKWLKHFDHEPKRITLIRGGKLHNFTLPEVNRNFYSEYFIEPLKELSHAQKTAFKAWST
jgi:predicted metalloprotease with PDZ domain